MTSSASAAGEKALLVGATVASGLATALLVLVALDVVYPEPLRTTLLAVNGAVTRLVPSALSGILVFALPLGGAVRGDFAIVAIMLYVIAWALRRAATSLRAAATRGE